MLLSLDFDTREISGVSPLYQPRCVFPKCKLQVGPLCLFDLGTKGVESDFSAECLVFPIILTNVPTGEQETAE